MRAEYQAALKSEEMLQASFGKQKQSLQYERRRDSVWHYAERRGIRAATFMKDCLRSSKKLASWLA